MRLIRAPTLLPASPHLRRSLLHSTRGSPVNLKRIVGLVVWEGHNSQDSLRKPDTLLCSITLSCHPLSSRERAADACLDHSTVLREPTNLRPYITHHTSHRDGL